MKSMMLQTQTQTPSRAPVSHPSADARREALSLPLDTRFSLGEEITPVQRAFLAEHGFVVFSEVASKEEVDAILGEIDRIEQEWLMEGRTEVNGIPVFVGRGPSGGPFIQRFAFTSLHSDYLRSFIRDARFEPVRTLVGAGARVGDDEKDGLVFNRNLNIRGSAYSRLGWHTDGLRDLFLNRAIPGPMLNVGMHFDHITAADGGLRLIPGSHRQGFWDTLTRKPYFVSHKPDPEEIAVETRPGDLTVHDGRMWHRVQASPYAGERSLRRTMYVPYLTDEYSPKNAESRTPFYHRLAELPRRARVRLGF